MYRLEQETFLPYDIQDIFPFFAEASNLEAITPPWLSFRILTPLPIAMQEGTHIAYRLKIMGIPFSWKTLISVWEPPYRFVDEQLQGPYRHWHHEHAFESVNGGTLMRDTVHFALPFAPFGHLAYPLIKIQLSFIFDYRTRALHHTFPMAQVKKRIFERVKK